MKRIRDLFFKKTRTLDKIIPSLDIAASKLECSPIYQAEIAKTEFVDQIFLLMEEKHINKSQLAKTMGKSPQYIGRVLNESANFTIEKMAEFSCVFKKKLKISLVENNDFQFSEKGINVLSSTTANDLVYDLKPSNYASPESDFLKEVR